MTLRMAGQFAAPLLVACGDALVPVNQLGSNEAEPIASTEGPGSGGTASTDALTPPQAGQDETRCILSRNGRLHRMELESGRLLLPLNAYSEATGSLGRIGDHIYAYDLDEGGIAKISAIDGSVEIKSLAGSDLGFPTMVTAWGSRIVLYEGRQISIFASFDDIPNAPTARYPSDMLAEYIAVTNDVLFGAWHSTDEIAAFDLERGTDLPPLSLMDYDDWVYGLGVTNSGEIAMFVPDDVVQIRDRQTGAIVRNVPAKWSLPPSLGMACGGAWPALEVRQPPPADTVSVQAACGPNGYSTFDSGASGSPSLHVVSVQKPTESGVVNVHVGRSGDAMLVLVAHDAIRWNVTQGSNTNLTAVIVQGNDMQMLTAPAGVTTNVTYRADGGAPTLSYANDWNSYKARRLRFNVEQLTKLSMRSFSACSEGASFTIE